MKMSKIVLALFLLAALVPVALSAGPRPSAPARGPWSPAQPLLERARRVLEAHRARGGAMGFDASNLKAEVVLQTSDASYVDTVSFDLAFTVAGQDYAYLYLDAGHVAELTVDGVEVEANLDSGYLWFSVPEPQVGAARHVILKTTGTLPCGGGLMQDVCNFSGDIGYVFMGGYLVPYFYDQTAIFQPDTLVTLTVPDPGGLVQGVSDGVLISQESQPGAATFSFSFATGEVFPSYMAFFGALETFESSWNGLPVACVLAAANAEYGQPCLDMVADVLSFHSDLYGDYPFGSIKVIEGGPIAAGGYGAPANVVLNSDVVAYFDYSFAGVISHELGHQWWGAGVTFNGPGATPMTEGLAEVSACQYQRLVLDQTRCLAQASRGYLATLPAGKDLPLNDPTIAYDAGDWALTLIYSKGHVALQAGRLALGDEAFFGGLRALAAQGGMLPSEALFEALSAQAGASQVDAYLRPWFEQGGHPRVSLSRGVGEDGGLTLQVSQPDEPRFAFPLPVALDTLDGSQARLVLVPAEATAQVTVPDAPATASCLALNGEQELPLEVPAATQADPDLDGVVNGSDLLLLMRYFGLVGYDAQYNYANAAFSPVVDFDGSGVIDQGDLDLLTARFGQPVE